MFSLPILGDFDGSVFAQAALFYTVAFAMLAALGIGPALMLPKKLATFGWAFAPYLGCSLLVTTGSLIVAAGGTVQQALVVSAVAAAILLVTQLRRRSIPSPTALVPILLLSIASYAITALAMARQGTLGYVGPAYDPYVSIRYAEWLKYHTAPLLSPTWYSTLPPPDGWAAPGAALQSAIGDINYVLQRGVRYWEGAIGVLLGWDSALIFRPAQAFMLSLAGSGTYLFCRTLLGTSRRTALLAGILISLNGTNLFWVSIGHPGQGFWIAILPVALVLTFISLEGGPVLPAALAISSLLASYYQAIAFLVVLIGPAVIWRVARAGNAKENLFKVGSLGLAVGLLALPVHLYAVLLATSGFLYKTVGWQDPGFPSIGEALGTFPPPAGVGLAGGSDGLAALGLGLPPEIMLGATIIALVLAARGLARGGKPNVLRPLLLGLGLILTALYLANYPYGYVKSQSVAAFILVSAAATGAAGFSGRLRAFVPVVAIALMAVIGVAGTNMAAVESALWVPAGNVWKTATWEGAEFGKALPPNSEVRLSPFLQANGETITMAGYFLRDQHVVGAYGLQGLTGLHLLPETEAARQATPKIELLDGSEIPGFRGFLPADLIWSGNLAAAYRHPSTGLVQIDLTGSDGRTARLPLELPAKVRVRSLPDSEHGNLLATFSVQEGTAEVVATWSTGQRTLTLQPGLAVRSLPADVEGVSLTQKSGRTVLMAVAYRPEVADPDLAQDFRQAVAVVGFSRLESQLITRLAYFDAAMKAGASLDVFPAAGSTRVGWFHLPTVEDGFLRQMEISLDPATLSPRIVSNGEEVKGSFTSPAKDSRSLSDGEYVAYLSPVADTSLILPRRIPLYRYRLNGGTITDFEQFPISLAWTNAPAAR